MPAPYIKVNTWTAAKLQGSDQKLLFRHAIDLFHHDARWPVALALSVSGAIARPTYAAVRCLLPANSISSASDCRGQGVEPTGRARPHADPAETSQNLMAWASPLHSIRIIVHCEFDIHSVLPLQNHGELQHSYLEDVSKPREMRSAPARRPSLDWSSAGMRPPVEHIVVDISVHQLLRCEPAASGWSPVPNIDRFLGGRRTAAHLARDLSRLSRLHIVGIVAHRGP
ncbi:hypothetical protein GE09DRAFT_1112135 [Coniochaeta sp. 2T2.1]|nr:hypothetical protein GE09DRAFT_1112135 [Coniochaeta sp. 2T2.1]